MPKEPTGIMTYENNNMGKMGTKDLEISNLDGRGIGTPPDEREAGLIKSRKRKGRSRSIWLQEYGGEPTRTFKCILLKDEGTSTHVVEQMSQETLPIQKRVSRGGWGASKGGQ